MFRDLQANSATILVQISDLSSLLSLIRRKSLAPNNSVRFKGEGQARSGWVRSIGLPRSSYATHSMRRTKATLIYRKTGNLRAVQLLLGHSKIDSTVLYLGVEVEDALSLAESIEL